MTQQTLRATVLFAAIAAVAPACGRLHLGGDRSRQVDASLRKVLRQADRPDFVTRDAEGTRLWKQTRRFYERRQYEPAWIENAAPRPQMDDLIHAIEAADREGLDPELYSATLLRQRRDEASKGFLSKKGFDPGDAGTMDAWLTYLYMKYASDLADGLSDLAHADPSWRIATETIDPLARLEAALRDKDVSRSLSDLAPAASEYRALRNALADYRKHAAEGGWPAVPATLALRPGQRSPRVALLARRLAASGDFSGSVPPENRAAQYRRGLEAGGPAFPAPARSCRRRRGRSGRGARVERPDRAAYQPD